MDKTRTRTAESTDAENVARLVNIAFRPERFFIDADRTDPDKVRALLRNGKFLLAEEAGMLVGCVYVEDYCRTAGCLVMDLTIVNLRKELPEYYRRRGYGESGTLPFPEDQHPPKMPCHLVRMSKPLGFSISGR